MKVAFIYPAFESLAVELLAAMLRREGHEVRLFFDPHLFDDAFITVRPLARLLSKRAHVADDVVAWDPDIIAFSLLTDEYLWFQDMGRRIRKKTGATIIAGGIHVTSAPEQTVASNSFLDFAVRGEGELAIVELIEGISRGRVEFDMPNLVCRYGGGVRVNPTRPLIQNLDSLPWADKSIYQGTGLYPHDVYTILMSRGCPYRCSFCNSNLLHRVYEFETDYLRTRSVDDVMAELRWAKENYNPAVVNVYDEIFGVDIAWFEEFSHRYEKEIGIPYMCCVYPSMVNERRAELLGKSGCIKVDMGVQSVATQKGKKREILNRSETNEQVINAFGRLRANGIAVAAENIVNLPGETEEDLEQMARFYNRHRPDVMKFFWLRYYPNTEIVDTAERMGLLDKETVEGLAYGKSIGSLMTGGTNARVTARKFYTLFVLLKVLPRGIVDWILDHRIWRFFPSFGLLGVSYLVSRILNRSGANEEAMVRRLAKHYAYNLGLMNLLGRSEPEYFAPPSREEKATQMPPNRISERRTISQKI